MYKVGLVHGRFQPFHNGHKHLVDTMIRNCRIPVVIIGSVQLTDEDNFLTKEERAAIIKSIYGDRVVIGFCWDIDRNSLYWDNHLASIVFALVGALPEAVFAGPGYGVRWVHVPAVVEKVTARVGGISGTEIRRMLRNGKDVSNLVPPETLAVITAR